MSFIENLQSRMMPRGASPQGIFAPPGANGPVKFWDLVGSYQGPGAERLLAKLEQAGKVGPGAAEQAAAGAGRDALWSAPERLVTTLSGRASGGAGGVAGLAGGAPIAAAVGGAGQLPVNPIYQSPLYASLGFGNQVNVPMMADSVAGLVDDAAPLAADLAGGGAAASTGARTAQQALMEGFEQLSQLPNADRPGILAAAIDTRAAAGAGADSIDVLIRALIEGPLDDSAPALRSAIDAYAAKVIAGAGDLAPTAAKVAERLAPAAAEFASPAARAFGQLSPTMAAVVRAAGPIDASMLRGISAFAKPLESSSTACLTGIAELMTRVRL